MSKSWNLIFYLYCLFSNIDEIKLQNSISIYETGAYHCILFDGSTIRTYFKFHKNILLQESLLYWTAPIIISEEEVDELGICEAVNMHFSDEDSRNKKPLCEVLSDLILTRRTQVNCIQLQMFICNMLTAELVLKGQSALTHFLSLFLKIFILIVALQYLMI